MITIPHIGHSEYARQYIGVISMLVESYLLVMAWSIGIIVPLSVRDSDIKNLAIALVFLPSFVYIKVGKS